MTNTPDNNDRHEREWIECGGCGAKDPKDRCIGCLHYFGEGSWDTRKIYETAPPKPHHFNQEGK
jgi:hypothetical protein